MTDIKKWLLKNIEIKIFSLFLAIILWVYVASGQNPIVENYIDVSLTVKNLEENLAIKEIPDNISIGVKGPRDVLSNLSSNQIAGIIDLINITEAGNYKLQIETEVPQRVKVTRIIPSEIKVEIDRILTEVMEVNYSLIGTPKKGYSLSGAPIFNQDSIKVTGAQSKLDLVKQILCPIDISNIEEDRLVNVKLEVHDINDTEVEGLTIEPEIIEVAISVTEGYPQKYLEVKPRIVGKPASGYYISQILVNPDMINIYGNYSKINDLQYLETIPIDVNGITKTLSVKVSPALSEGIYLVEGETALTEVNIQIKENIIQKTIIDVPIMIKNASPFISFNLEPQFTDVTIEGKSDLVEKISSEDIEVFVEFVDDLETDQQVKLKAMLPEKINLIKINPEEVNLKINSKK